MTTSIAHEVSKRRALAPAEPRFQMDVNFARLLRLQLDRTTRVRFPDSKYARNPVGFFREILGVEPWSKQIEILEAVRDYARVAVCSGHKVSKSHSAAGLALWWYCSHPDARVVMSSTTSRQVDQILWRELRMMRARSGRCTECKERDPDGLLIQRPCEHSALIDGEQGELARTGLKSADFREIVGFTAREAEAVAGISGRRLLYILDESSGIPEVIFEAIEGNRAGGAHIVLLGNGTRNEGEFFEAFYSKQHLYKTIRISSEETPNVVSGEVLIPGLATREWIEEKRLEWGEDSPLYQVRVKGQHALHEEGKVFPLHMITEAEKRWEETPEAGRLFIGLDPAGETGSGDDTAMCARRGQKMLALLTKRSLNEEQHIVQVLDLISKYKLPRETPVVVMDRDGNVGSRVYYAMREFADKHPAMFELVGVRASDKAVRRPEVYDRMRDALVGNVEQWLRDKGAILEDAKLAAEMHALEWRQHVNGKLKITPKDQLRKALGRSPDRFDSFALSLWEPLSLQSELPRSAAAVANDNAYGNSTENTFDPYAAGDAWRR
jgi:hypothetical protein